LASSTLAGRFAASDIPDDTHSADVVMTQQS